MSETQIYFLEMTEPEQLQASLPCQGLSVIEAQIDQWRFNQFLYQLVGHAWQWTDKLDWSQQQWQDYVQDSDLRTWAAYYQGSIAGYFELHFAANGDTEIKYFGLAPEFIGRGMGGYLLSQALTQAWQVATTRRVWVHTCSLDHPSALANYQARGFHLYQTLPESEAGL
ncbi:GNAT family N-acetyltransferase [Motilimonas pumila]|uniref:GNAT family N-acetyltransferase n=1 Tax=Motilimonas pumila TaxID=2303987 RepID=A0A418YAY3_9GAMM|nr:GNAT family N-acetyltransferase [Motilimonas pumila]RJG40131.1 GNAT family N-acetyltransferase [Motilimonas pumila]